MEWLMVCGIFIFVLFFLRAVWKATELGSREPLLARLLAGCCFVNFLIGGDTAVGDKDKEEEEREPIRGM